MLKIEQSILEDFGLDKLPKEVQQAAFHDIYLTLQRRVGMRLSKEMTEEQLATVETLKEDDDEAAFTEWLEETFPDYQSIVAEELQGMKDEVATGAAQILEADQKNNS